MNEVAQASRGPGYPVRWVAPEFFACSEELRGLMPPARHPRLLVSVRDVTELAAALEGGADIIDIKDPQAGSLGRAPFGIMHGIADALRSEDFASRLTTSMHGVPEVSIAYGELTEWSAIATLPTNVRWVKLGLADCHGDHDWRARWLSARAQLSVANPQIGWIGVAYADWKIAKSPPLEEVLHGSTVTKCAGVLIDTFSKHGSGLRDWIDSDLLGDFLATAHRSGLITAVAGSLRIDDLAWVKPLRPDIVAIRGAACRGGARTGAIDAAAVAEFRAALHG